ncbi:MAG: MCE family protein [Candidatus Zixiibacteriota bacterium]|nr:MAG: MCE family protein [candidate division Zixibacteria bacterium]
MKRTTVVKWGSLKIGILLMFVIAVMFWASFSGGGTSIFDPKGKFICYFRNVSGLVSGSPVWMSGVEVGNVRSVDFVNLDSLRQVKVVCRVKKSVWDRLTKDARVQLGTIGFLGDKYVEVIPGITGGPAIEEMDVIETIDAGDAAAMFKAGEEAIDDARAFVSELDILLARMNRGEGTLGRIATDDQLYRDMTALLAKLTDLTSGLQKNQERIISSIEKTATSVENLSTKVDNNTGSIGRLMNDPALYDNLSASTAKLDTLLRRINDAEGTLGLLASDTALYSEMTNLMARMNNLITDIQKNPRKYFKFSVF